MISQSNKFLNSLSKNHVLILMVFAAVLHFTLIHSFHLFTYAQVTDKPLDSYSYENAARHLYGSFRPDAIRPIGYPLLIGVPYLLRVPENLHIYWIYVMQFGIWLFTALLIYKAIVSISGNQWYAGLGMLLFVINVGNIAFTVQTLTETVYTFLLSLFSFLFITYLLSRKVNYLSWAFFVLCFSVIVKPALYYFIPFVFIYILYHLKSNLRGRALIICIAGLSLIILQICLMHSRYGRFTVTFIDNSTLYNCIDAEAVAMKESRPLNVVRNERNDELARCFKDDKWDNFSEMAHADFKDQLHNNFKNLLRVYKINLIVNSKDGSSLIADKYNSNPSWFIDKLSWLSIGQNIFNVMLLLLVIPVLWLFSFRKKLFKLPTAALFIMALEGIGLFIYFSSGLCFFQGDRYYVVFYPLTIVSVFVCIDYLRKQKSKG